MLGRALAVTPNTEEAEVVTGLQVKGPDSAARAAQRLAELGPRFAAIKLKDGGCMLWADGQAMHIAPVEVTVMDTTGAGDAFTGMFAIALLEGQTPGRAALLATVASHLAVTKWGSQLAYPTRAEILESAHRLTQS
jgi:ribokinase